jgi:FdhD protein
MIRSYTGKKNVGGDSTTVQDALVVESPLAIYINEIPLTITMQTPGNELELAVGLLIAEGIIKRKNPLPHFQMIQKETLMEVHFDIPDFISSETNQRSLLSISSCGICGKTEWSTPTGDALPASILQFSIQSCFDQMSQAQPNFEQSGGLHAAALFDNKGVMLCCFEDIGRHNAVDKCVGYYYTKTDLPNIGMISVSGRISYEIIAKCFMAKIPVIAAVSAPSSLAVDFAKEWGIQLFAFCRENRFTQYA